MPPRATVRDYQAEERKRNAEARALGFRNRYELRKYRAGGQLPSAKKLASGDAAAEKQQRDLLNARSMGFDNVKEYRQARKDARAWSDAHSRQPVSKYRPSMRGKEFQDYWEALVNPWARKRLGMDSEFDKAALKRWIVDDTHHLTEEEYDESPRY